MHLKKQCTFLMPEVEYLGHKICQEGMSSTESKVHVVSDAPEPESGRIEIVPGVSELLWKVPVQPSHHCSTLYSLLKKNAHQTWGKSRKAAFKGVKGLLQSFDLLVHFDLEELLILAYDALLTTRNRVIPLLAKWLRKANSLCIVPQRRGNTCILTRKHCPSPLELSNYQYLYDRQVIIHSDHKPLVYIFDKAKAEPLMVSARIQHHW